MIAERGLPIMRDTGCMVGCHVFVSIGRLPEEGDYCKCELMQWDAEKQTAVSSQDKKFS